MLYPLNITEGVPYDKARRCVFCDRVPSYASECRVRRGSGYLRAHINCAWKSGEDFYTEDGVTRELLEHFRVASKYQDRTDRTGQVLLSGYRRNLSRGRI